MSVCQPSRTATPSLPRRLHFLVTTSTFSRERKAAAEVAVRLRAFSAASLDKGAVRTFAREEPAPLPRPSAAVFQNRANDPRPSNSGGASRSRRLPASTPTAAHRLADGDESRAPPDAPHMPTLRGRSPSHDGVSIFEASCEETSVSHAPRGYDAPRRNERSAPRSPLRRGRAHLSTAITIG